MNHAAALALAMAIDALLGEPRWLWSRIPHPAVMMGRAVAALDRRLNSGAFRRRKGIFAAAILALAPGLIGMILVRLPGAPAIEVFLVAILLAQRSLSDHVRAVADGLRLSLPAGRRAVARIVGRDTRDLDAPAIARATIESAAENFSDGVVAPMFWYLILGLPGILAYKAINTADSMIGYKNERHRDFGMAVARLDDFLNWVPARVSAGVIAAAYFRPDAWRYIRRDAPLHRSPNAGWPEAAFAVCLGISLAGPRSYGGEARKFPWVYPEGRRDLTPSDIDRAATALWRSWTVAFTLVIFLAVV